ncbi:MAG: glycosyltransferase family 1 protein [Bacteroidales bacterium]|nr:glycosyltransferase family 1 protein [Bacteroidales bacterium]
MKILLFNLGSVEERIISWDTEGYKSLFEHDVILWGPIPDTDFSFNGKPVTILKIDGQTSIKSVFERLPEGWVPDIVTCDTSVLNYVTDIYLCPVKTILFTRDAWADTIYNRNLVEFFDFICHSVIDIDAYKALNVNILPLASFPVSLPGPNLQFTGFSDRTIDVICIANYYEGFYHERYKTLYNLSASNSKNLNIHYHSGLSRREIHEYYRNSKIVVDWAHTLSNRSYEAALNGCLLFSHEDNTVMKTFWVPGEEYIPYNENNLYDKIVYFVNHTEEAEKIIARTREKIKSLPVGFGQYTYENIIQATRTDVDIKARIERNSLLPSGELAYRLATPLMYNYRYDTDYPSDWKEIYFERIDRAISSISERNSKILPLIEAARVSFLLRKYELCSDYLSELQKILPGYGWIYYLQGRILFLQKEYRQAFDTLRKANECAFKYPDLLQKYILPFIDKDLNCDGRRITDYLWQMVYKHENECQVKALLHFSYDLSGDILLREDKPDEAKKDYINAISNSPYPDSIKKAAPLCLNSHDYNKLLEITDKGTQDSPYETVLVLFKALSLIELRRVHLAVQVLSEHRKALKAFKKIRRMRLVQGITIIISIIALINRRIGSKFILKIIGVLSK